MQPKMQESAVVVSRWVRLGRLNPCLPDGPQTGRQGRMEAQGHSHVQLQYALYDAYCTVLPEGAGPGAGQRAGLVLCCAATSMFDQDELVLEAVKVTTTLFMAATTHVASANSTLPLL